jgi:hypothetical protein
VPEGLKVLLSKVPGKMIVDLRDSGGNIYMAEEVKRK